MPKSINKLLGFKTIKLSSWPRRLYILLFTFSILQLSCTSRPNIQGKGGALMQGVWNEDSVAFSNKLTNYTQHHFKFTCDSVYIDFVTHSKVNFYEDS